MVIGFFSSGVIASNACATIPGASLYEFGVLSSRMHMAWVKKVCGRIKSDIRYSKDIVYNNYRWPAKPTESQQATVEWLAQAVLDARAQFPDSTLAELYDPLLMPPLLLRAHQQFDRAVERCYRPEPCANDQARVEFLFFLYEKLSAPLLPIAKIRRSKARR